MYISSEMYRWAVPTFYFGCKVMNVYQTQLEARVAEILEPALVDMGYSLVRVRIGGSSKRKQLQLMLERADGTPVTVGDCEKISKHSSVLLDVEDPIEQEYTLEVSSTGLDRPLTRPKDFNTFAGQSAKVTLKIAVLGQRNFTGTITDSADDTFSFTVKDTGEIHSFPFNNVSEAHLIFEEKKNNKFKPKNRR
jgi:ribosome maturation factor RimP